MDRVPGSFFMKAGFESNDYSLAAATAVVFFVIVLAITLFGECLDVQRLLSFGLIWAGLAVYVGGSVFNRTRRAAAS